MAEPTPLLYVCERCGQRFTVTVAEHGVIQRLPYCAKCRRDEEHRRHG